MFDPTKSKSNAIKILNDAPNLEQTLTDLKFIPLDEPFYGTDGILRVEDFDSLFINSSTDSDKLYSSNLVSNFIKFNKHQDIKKAEEIKDTPIFNIDDEISFPSLSATTSVVPKLVKSDWTKKEKLSDSESEVVKVKEDLDIDEDTYDYTNAELGIDEDTYDDIYKHKYLKYKEKYLALKNYIN
jgi:hypothetical protein